MKVTTVSVTVSKTLQLPKFNPSVVTLTYTGELGKDDTAKEAAQKLYKMASNQVAEMIQTEVDRHIEEGPFEASGNPKEERTSKKKKR